MRIHFSNVNFSSRTGPNTFAYRLASKLAERGHHIVDANENYDTFLAFIEPASMPLPSSRFIQRLDGIWFKPEQFHTHNVGIKWAYENAHHVVWQSEFDRGMTEHHWGEKEGTVIHNGIDLKQSEKRLFLNKTDFYGRTFVCSANWHPQKRLAENVRLYRKIRKPGDCLLVLGNNPDCTLDPSNNELYFGSLSHEECLHVYKSADWMIHLAWLDHCPNVVVEALSQGCPVICASTGGTKELVNGRGIIIKDKPYNFELTDYDNPPSLDFEGFDLPAGLLRPTFEIPDLDINFVADRYEAVLRG